MSRRTVRESWVADVRRSTEIGDACRVLLLTMATEGMTEKGYASIPRAKLADLLGRHPQRVTDRIAEAVRVGFLVRVGGPAHEGKTATYAASFPTPRGNGGAVSSQVLGSASGNGSAVTSDRLPPQDQKPAVCGREVTAERLANTRARARVTYRSRETKPVLDDSRADGDHDGELQTGAWEEWLPTPAKRPGSDTTTAGEVA